MIYNSPSIYKQGGGGGGFKDGGQLVDGDYINVENNAISTYENTSRSVINYVIDVKAGEQLNTIIELTNNVNATINVYKFVNGVGVLLSNIGGNTVTANNYYNINIIGDSFSIENVSAPDSSIYEFIDGVMYGFKKIGGVYWCLEDYKTPISSNSHISGGFTYTLLKDILNHNFSPYRLPNSTDLQNLINNFAPSAAIKLKATTIWNNGTPATAGTNESGLAFYGCGNGRVFGGNFSVSDYGVTCTWAKNEPYYNVFSLRDNDANVANNGHWVEDSITSYCCIRLVKDV